MGTSYNFDFRLPSAPSSQLDTALYNELVTIYNSIRLIAEQVGGENRVSPIDYFPQNPGGIDATIDSFVTVRYLTIDTAVVTFYITGISNSASLSFELPDIVSHDLYCPTGLIVDNSITLATSGSLRVTANTNIVNLYTDMNSGIWTTSGTKSAAGQFIYNF